MINFYRDKQQIIAWLDKYEVKNYTLVPDEKYGFVVDVDGSVILSSKRLLVIPFKFNKVKGTFSCDDNKLTSLEFSPQEVSGGFNCNQNQLTSLEFCPQKIGGSFYCSYNQLISLKFCPEKVVYLFFCKGNPGLKEIQSIENFNLIYLEHKKILAFKLAEKLNNDLPSDILKKTTKIKI